eukprot:TRINITY_DN2534_c0_g1_i1.p1 TRINITY_DN2534_c0_g1~~TRINITY_DN2534_c0_g1_i1.p1  ORF type:complete len:136 (-),score=30.00 TRINITY_DN2534_c0_g1_i1:101-508(-)
MVICIEGLPSEKVDSKTGLFDEKLHFISTSKELSEQLLAMEHAPLENAVITGVTGLLLAEGALQNVQMGCLLAPAAAHYPDAYGAVNVVKTLAAWLKDVEIDISPLELSAQKLHQNVTSFLKKDKESESPPNMFM